MKLNANEAKVLTYLAECVQEDMCSHFKPIVNHTGLDRRVVRLACRSLARKGLAQYAKGLWTDDGELAGAGYGPTKAGMEFHVSRPVAPAVKGRR
jgi:hypothetical protein